MDANGNPLPGAGQQQPGAVQQQLPGAGQQQPGAVQQQPGAVQQQPGAGQQQQQMGPLPPAAQAQNANDPLVQILRQLTLQTDRYDRQLQNALQTPRVKIMNCKSYTIGQDWHNWAMHFRENVRATGGFGHNDPRLDQSCCSFLGAKLEPGATLNAYNNLPQPLKDNWTDVNRELARLFCNEEEKQLFLNNPGALKKGMKSFLEYKNELTRRVELYQPELSRVPVEFQRQLVNRFIEGIEDANLQRKLRFNCRRNNTLDFAYEYAVDYEATQVEERVKEVGAVAPRRSVVAAAAAPETGRPTPVAPSPHMQILERSHDPKVKANEIAIEQLRASNAQTNDSLSILKKEVNDKFSQWDGRFDRLEDLIVGSIYDKRMQSGPAQAGPAQAGPAQPGPAQAGPAQAGPAQQAYAPRPFVPRPFQNRLWRPQYRPRYAGNPLAQQYPVTPGVTGGSGFLNNNLASMYAGPVQADAPQIASVATENPPVMTPDGATSAASTTASGAPMAGPGVMGATAPQYFAHPMTDAAQNTYPHDEFWGEYLDYEACPVGYANPQGGTYSYPQNFQ